MCKFRPFNKHILIEKKIKQKKSSQVLIPEDIKVQDNERYGVVRFICASSDCERLLLNLNKDQETWATHTGTMDDVFTTSARKNGDVSLIVDKRMIEEVTIDESKFEIVHQNYVVGVIDE
jgi:hypothetical protein